MPRPVPKKKIKTSTAMPAQPVVVETYDSTILKAKTSASLAGIKFYALARGSEVIDGWYEKMDAKHWRDRLNAFITGNDTWHVTKGHAHPNGFPYHDALPVRDYSNLRH